MSDLFMDMHQRRRVRCNGVPAATAAPAACCNSGSGASYSSASTAAADEHEEEEDDSFANVLSLKLRKPKSWKWELSTSRSCSHIALPRILLYDHKGELLVDLNSQAEQTVRQAEQPQPAPSLSPSSTRKRASRARAATTNLTQSIRQVLDNEFSDLQIQEATPSPLPSAASTRGNSAGSACHIVDFNTNELPDYKIGRRSSSLRSVRFKDEQPRSLNSSSSFHVVDLPTPPSTTTTTTTTTATTPTHTGSSSSGPREKRRYRRSRSSGRSPAHSESILERFSFNRGRYSSPEYTEEQEVRHAPRYYLCTSNAGTLVVQDDSFSRCRRRRKPRPSSSEQTLNSSGSRGRSRSITALKQCGTQLRVPGVDSVVDDLAPQSGSLQNVAQAAKKKFPVRRYRSDGNVLLQQPDSTSEEDDLMAAAMQQQEVRQRPRRYAYFRRHNKRDLVSIDSGNEVVRSLDNPTAR